MNNRTLRTLACICLFIIPAAFIHAAIAATELEHLPHAWPYRVQLQEDLEIPEKGDTKLPQHLAGILIRVEGDQAIIDFGRFGLYPVPFHVTNILQLANAINDGRMVKDRPNYGNMVAPRLIEPDPDFPGAWRKFPSIEALDTRGFAFIYLSRLEQLDTLFACAREALSSAGDKAAVLILVPLFEGSYPEIQQRIMASGLPLKLFVEHLREGYIHALHHEPEEDSDSVVVTDLDGKIISRNPSLDLGGLSLLPRKSAAP